LTESNIKPTLQAVAIREKDREIAKLRQQIFALEDELNAIQISSRPAITDDVDTYVAVTQQQQQQQQQRKSHLVESVWQLDSKRWPSNPERWLSNPEHWPSNPEHQSSNSKHQLFLSDDTVKLASSADIAPVTLKQKSTDANTSFPYQQEATNYHFTINSEPTQTYYQTYPSQNLVRPEFEYRTPHTAHPFLGANGADGADGGNETMTIEALAAAAAAQSNSGGGGS
jgi:hypothetical protein